MDWAKRSCGWDAPASASSRHEGLRSIFDSFGCCLFDTTQSTDEIESCSVTEFGAWRRTEAPGSRASSCLTQLRTGLLLVHTSTLRKNMFVLMTYRTFHGGTRTDVLEVS